MERYIPCPSNNEGCRYKSTPRGCFEDSHHLYPQRTADTGLKRKFGDLAINRVFGCRNIHDLLDTFPPPEYPDKDEMRRIVLENGGFDG